MKIAVKKIKHMKILSKKILILTLVVTLTCMFNIVKLHKHLCFPEPFIYNIYFCTSPYIFLKSIKVICIGEYK